MNDICMEKIATHEMSDMIDKKHAAILMYY